MKDRVPENPGRVLITPEGGGNPYYAVITRADNPTEEGTPICKATLLTDETAAALELEMEDPTVNDALYALARKAQPAVLNVTTEPGVVVTATKDDIVLTATANSDGLAVLYPDEFGTWNLSARISATTITASFYIDAIKIYSTTMLAS